MELKKLGRYLQKERRARKINLKDIAGETRINIRYLKAIEEGRADDLLQEPYLTVFLKAFSQQIGLDFQELKKIFPTEATPSSVEERSPSSHRRYWMGLLLLPILILIIMLYPKKTERRVILPLPAGNTQDTASLALSPPESLTVISQDTLPQMPTLLEPLKLELVGLESTWVYIQGDSEVLWEGILTAHQRRVLFSIEGFLATVGNAGGVEIFLNGKKLRSLGPRKKVVHNLKIDRETQERLLQK